MPVQATASAEESAVKLSNLTIILYGGFGAAVAILADLYLKDKACAITSLDQKLASTLQLHVHPLIVAFLLISIGVGLCFVFPEKSTRKTFFRGASVLTMVMTMTPYEVHPGIPQSPEQPQPQAEIRHLDSLFVPEVFAQVRNSVEAPRTVRLDVHLAPPRGKTVSRATYTLLNPETGEILAQSTLSGTDASFYVTRRDYLLRVEVPGCRIVAVKPQLQAENSKLTIPLQATWMPVPFQRVMSSQLAK